jgi:hypothetical protein
MTINILTDIINNKRVGDDRLDNCYYTDRDSKHYLVSLRGQITYDHNIIMDIHYLHTPRLNIVASVDSVLADVNNGAIILTKNQANLLLL